MFERRTENLTEYQINLVFNLVVKIRTKSNITEIERNKALEIIDIILDKAPEILYEIDNVNCQILLYAQTTKLFNKRKTMLNIHFCDIFKDKIKNQSFEETVTNKIKELEMRSNLKAGGSILSFGKIFILKTSKPHTRTIIETQTLHIEGDEIKCLFIRDIIANKNFEYSYGKVIYPKIKAGIWLKENPLEDEEKTAFIDEYRRKNTSYKQLEFTPTHLKDWFSEFKLNLQNNIYETEDWVKYALNDSFTEGMNDKYVNTVRLVLLELLKENIDVNVLQQKEDIKICTYINHNIGVIFSKINTDENNVIYLLFNAAHVENQSEHWLKNVNLLTNNQIDFTNNLESIRRKAFRSYPKWTLNKDELWFNIQKSREQSNLSLTREQIEFFKSFKFPHYINGQAGSGKSTMLYYLFSNAYYYKCCDSIKGEIIFLTENQTLLEHTKNAVYDLLTNNPEFNTLTLEQRNQSRNYFFAFKDFLISLIPEEDRYYFRADKYLDFSTFKMLYENSNLPRHIIEKYSAEESWFTIITYIYGYKTDRIIKSSEYCDIIPNKSQVIPKEMFFGIEENVLPFYEKLIKHDEYWDKLKIIRYIDENIGIKNKYTILICDEAQDFCRVELRFILRLSEYLQYDLSDTKQVPVVFAGDPNQTVNPTGFRQDEMISMLYQELQEIARFNFSPKDNIYNPIFNYRSSSSVVALANFVQYHRLKNLGINQLKPQEAKRPMQDADKTVNIFLSYNTINNNKEIKNNLKEKLKYKIFILPVDAHEKDMYIAKHKFLSEIEKPEIRTAVESKGAEYQHVVLYGFGEYFLENLKQLTDNKTDIDSQFKRRYFFNKLYVAITRAQTELIIIDSENAAELFWQKLVNQVEIISEEWNILKSLTEITIIYNPDSINSIIHSTLEDAIKNAKTDKDKGIYEQNPSRLKVASNLFFKLGNCEEAYECLAEAEKIKTNWKAAAEFYLNESLKIPFYEKAATCFFNGRLFKELETKIANNWKDEKNDIYLVIARLFSNDTKIMSTDIEILHKNREVLYLIIKDIDWRKDIIFKFIENIKYIQKIEHKKDYVTILEKIATSQDPELWKEIAELRFVLKDYKEALDIWKDIDDFENNQNYFFAAIEVAKINNNTEQLIIALDGIKKFKTETEQKNINIQIWETHKNNDSTIETKEYYLVIYKSILILNIQDEIVNFANITEKKYVNHLHEIISFYKEILAETKIEPKIIVFIIERLAKNMWKINKTADTINNINLLYLELAQNKNIVYQEFTQQELEEISDFPKNIRLNISQQFNNISIKNFRQFENINLNKLGLYNLILGVNNVGKTSLLEALLFDTNPENFIKNLFLANTERRKTTKIRNNEGEEKFLIKDKNILKDFINKKNNSNEIIYNISEKRNTWNYEIKYLSEDDRNYVEDKNIDINEYIKYIADNKITYVYIYNIIKKLQTNDLIRMPLIPYGKGYGEDLAQVYYEEIEKHKIIRNKFINSMKCVIPKIERISANTETGEIDIEETDTETAQPLYQYGEGANKLFRILVQISLQKKKFLLIDEIDAGIHFSIFRDFWKAILNAASYNEVQIFATAHNIECLKFFKDVLATNEMATYQKHARTITIRQLPNKQIKAYIRQFNEFQYEIDNQLDIRGGEL